MIGEEEMLAKIRSSIFPPLVDIIAWAVVKYLTQMDLTYGFK